MRKYTLLIVLTVAFVVALTPGVAMANFAIHGGYTMETDACAGCHRAHTAASSITWSVGSASGSALLNSTASEIYEFCYTCHDAVSLGADTNVETGIYEGTDYGTQFETLNGGGFDSTIFTAQHMYTGSSWFAYGGGVTTDLVGNVGDNTAPSLEMSCSSCHDVHGSSNYRILKDLVAGRNVGGYDPTEPGYTEQDPFPTPWVVSVESGYPTMGWLLHEPGASQVSTYTPDYTGTAETPQQAVYAKAPSNDPERGMAGWCSACHVNYMQFTGAAYSSSDPTNVFAWWPGAGPDTSLVASSTLGYDSLDGWGAAVRHRHPVNSELAAFAGARSLIITTNPLPLAHESTDTATQDDSDWIDCLTCHVAHGSSAVMTGYADVADSTDPQPDSGTGGIPPTGDNALLRLNNRGVCENCHNK